MAVFYGNNAAFTPGSFATGQNWVLDASTTGNIGRVIEVSWGGEFTTTTAMRTRWVRPTTGATTTFTAIGAVGQANPSPTVANRFRFGSFSTPPTAPAAPAALYATSWNAHGGIGRWLAAPGEEWYIVGLLLGGQIQCANDIGVQATSMSAGVAWDELIIPWWLIGPAMAALGLGGFIGA